MDQELMQAYTALLRRELKLSLGCTEPIAIAYGAAYARDVLGCMPQRITVRCSGNVIKNASSVIVPLTGGERGIAAAAAAGAISARADLKLEVLTALTSDAPRKIQQALADGLVEVLPLETSHPLHIITEASAAGRRASVEIVDEHTRIGRVSLDGRELHGGAGAEDGAGDFPVGEIPLQSILAYADQVDLTDVADVLRTQVDCNLAVAREGLSQVWGAAVGQTLLSAHPDDLRTRLCSAAAAGSDARMNGCPLPVVINSGSGNQGITVSVPVALYAQERRIPEDRLLRGLCVANLIALKQKAHLGRLSAFCGAMCAATAAVCAIAYLDGAGAEVIGQIIGNALGTSGGMFCDGAKSSCAGKIAVALETAFLGYDMAKHGRHYGPYEGVVQGDAEETIAAIGRIGGQGMQETDRFILASILQGEKAQAARA